MGDFDISPTSLPSLRKWAYAGAMTVVAMLGALWVLAR